MAESAPTAVSLNPEGPAELPTGHEFKLDLEDVWRRQRHPAPVLFLSA